MTVDAPTMTGAHLRARGVRKTYGAVTALESAGIELLPGEVHGLVGDNGAGKSTFLKVLSGAVVPDAGTITLDGAELNIRKPQDALAAGIETVYQDLALVDTMSAYQNVFLGREEMSANGFLRGLNIVNDKKMRQTAADVLVDLGVKVPSINVTVKGMSGGQRQCLAIARAVLWGNRVVILDEPTAALGVREAGQVLDLISRLKERGVSIIIVSHNMQQLFQVADRATVMRLGRTIATRTLADTAPEELVGLITGAIQPHPSDGEPASAS